MYAVTEAAETAWEALFRRVAAEAGVALDLVRHPFPKPVAELWARPDLGAVFMCGWPFARGVADVVPVAAPVPAGGTAPVYWSDIVVAAESAAQSLNDLAGGRVGWTSKDSQSGFSAFRHLLRSRGGPRFGAELGPLVTPSRVIEAVAAGQADLGPVDSYAHALLRRFRPELTARVRVLATSEPTPIPLLVASPGAPAERLRAAFLAVDDHALLEPLGLAGFAPPPPRAAYAVMAARAREAEAAGMTGLLM